jgi:hypothetical protein
MHNPARAIPRQRLSNEEHSRFKQVFFLIWPVATFVYSLFTLGSRSSRFIVVLFYGLCGYFYPFSFSDNADVVRHATRFKEVANLPYTDFFARFVNLYGSDAYKPDLLQPFIDFTISRFTTDHRIYFMVLGLIVGWVLMYLIKTTFPEQSNARNRIVVYILFLLVLVLIPPYRISGFRQIMGLLVFSVGVYKVLVQNQQRFNWLVLASCFIHFSFLAVMPFYALYFVVRQQIWVYLFLVVIAYFLQDDTTLMLGEWSTDLQGQLGQRVHGYSSSGYIEYIGDIKENRNIFINNQLRVTAFFLFGLLLLLYTRYRKNFSHQNVALYAASLCIFIFTVLVGNLETTYLRFLLLYIVMCSILTARVLNDVPVKLALLNFAILFVVLMNFVIMTRKTIEYTGVQVLVPNVVVAFFLDTEASILDLVK